jgi:hypothetical protein
VRFSPEILNKEKLNRFVTRSSTRKKIPIEETKSETPIHCTNEEVVEVQSPPKKEDMTTKILKKQLKEA